MSRIQPEHRPSQGSNRRDTSSPGDQDRTPPPRHAQEAFRALLESRRIQSESVAQRQSDQRAEAPASPMPSDLELRLAEWSTAAELQHDLLARAGQFASHTAIGSGSPAAQASVVELIEKHVRRMLISAETGDADSGRSLMLKLNDEVLINCDLKLERTRQGWRLEASSNDHGTIGLLSGEVDKLKDRFAQAGLGALDVHVSNPSESDY